jgi:hypothetical protein
MLLIDNKVILWYYYVYYGCANCGQIYTLNKCLEKMGGWISDPVKGSAPGKKGGWISDPVKGVSAQKIRQMNCDPVKGVSAQEIRHMNQWLGKGVNAR